MSFAPRLALALSIALFGSAPSFAWEQAAMTALFANAEVVLKANQMVESGRPIFGNIEHRVLSETTAGPGNPYPVRVEEFAFDVDASFGDAIARVGKLTITQTTTRFPRAPDIEYTTKIETYPTGIILRQSKGAAEKTAHLSPSVAAATGGFLYWVGRSVAPATDSAGL